MVKVKILRPCISNGVGFLAGDTPTLSDDEANILIMMNKASTDLNAKVIINLEPIFEQIGGVDEDSLKRAIIAQLDKLDLGGLSESEVSAKVNTLKDELNLLITKNKTDLAKLQTDLANLNLNGGGIDDRRVVDIFYKSALTNNLISFDFEAWKKNFTVIPLLSVGDTFSMLLTIGGSYGSALADVKFYDKNFTLFKNVVTSKIDEQGKYYIAVFDLVRDEEVIATLKMQTTNYYDSNYKVWHCLYLANEEYSTASHYLLGSTSPVTLTFTIEYIKEGERITKMTFLPGVSGRYSKAIVVSRGSSELFNKTILAWNTLCEVNLSRTQEDIQNEIEQKYISCLPVT
ncbi:hypothetical protein CIG2463D_1476 [Campylobacter iguaniorum]|uniref:hypothetical protein n=1 Tax=Campylobacter iguaniorum TaxID=1244531 RepID=UPI00073A050B|nr:hypothetical protein [Campylobacter iguaniorum]ALV25041.1 hypothetical protein CIG2463D_1476 [Campylobacter iguaniorum]